jgi:protein-disulfide isomerase
MTENNLTKNERRLAAREKAAQLRQAEKARTKRKHLAIWLTTGFSVLAIGALVAFVVVGSNATKVEASTTSPANMSSDGAILTSPTELVSSKGYDLEKGTPAAAADLLAETDVPEIQIYLDYACPHCEEFEEANSVYLESLLESGRATVEFKPIVVIGTSLSFDGGNAAACVANYAPSKFLDFHTSLFKLTEAGGKTADFKPFVEDMKLDKSTDETVRACMNSNEFGPWLEGATETALALEGKDGEKLVTGTPTVVVDGVKYPYSPTDFQTFMEAVLAGQTPDEVIAAVDNQNN